MVNVGDCVLTPRSASRPRGESQLRALSGPTGWFGHIHRMPTWQSPGMISENHMAGPMSHESEPLTSHGMLSQLRRFDAAGWNRFTSIYAPIVYGWIRKAGLQEADSSDVTQNVLQKVFRAVGGFERRADGSFRAWLWTITRNEINGWFRVQRKNAQGAGGSTIVMNQLPDWVDSDDVPSEENAKAELIRRAIAVIRNDFKEHTWQAFWRRVVKGQPVAEIAEDLNMSLVAVRQARFRILARLRDYVELD